MIPRGSAPAPWATVADLESAFAALALSSLDRVLLRPVLAQLGAIDADVGDRVAVARTTVTSAAEFPFQRSVPVADTFGATFYARTIRLPSGRLLQAERRHPGDSELERGPEPAAKASPPALRLRELVTGDGRPLPPHLAIAVIDAATIVPHYPTGGEEVDG